jgi:uncharacterized membrane protein
MSSRSRSFRPAAAALAGLLGVSGVGHFARPGFFDAIVPRSLPGEPRSWTYASGAAELGVAAALAVPRTRRLGGYAAAALFVAVFPANVSMALRWSGRSPRERAIAYGRLPLQVPLVVWALRIARPPEGRR